MQPRRLEMFSCYPAGVDTEKFERGAFTRVHGRARLRPDCMRVPGCTGLDGGELQPKLQPCGSDDHLMWDGTLTTEQCELS